jgi:hypothetical protein
MGVRLRVLPPFSGAKLPNNTVDESMADDLGSDIFCPVLGKIYSGLPINVSG